MEYKVNDERKTVLKEQTILNFEYNTLEMVLYSVKLAIEMYGKDAVIQSYGEQYTGSNKENMYVLKLEPETDAEMAERIALEKDWAEYEETRDAVEFARLREKFGA